MTQPDNDTRPEAPTGGAFYLALAVGWLVIAFGLWELFTNVQQNHPTYTFTLLVGLNIFHDVVVPPVACAVGFLVSRWVPLRMRAQVAFGLFASAVVVLVGYVPWRGYGRRPDNLTVLPLDYTTAILTVLFVVWVIVLVLIAVPRLRSQSMRWRRSRSAPSSK